jgi:molybdenum cofactor cytidylyltransferase
MNLRQTLRVTKQSRIAFVGSGGKTTALFQLARLLEPPVVVTTSTHLGAWQTGFADRHIIISRAEDVDHSASQIEGVTLFTGAEVTDNRVSGLTYDALERISELSSLGFPVLVEADGSRQKPLKAPAAHEPAIPAWVNHVVVCMGLSGLGKPLTEETVHRAAEFSRISGTAVGEPITLEALFKVLTHPQGGLKNIPLHAKKSVILNQVDSAAGYQQIMRIANLLIHSFDSVSICSLEEKKTWANLEATAGIILAAGGASRYGQPKLLLDWKGKPLVRHVVETALASGLERIQVVIGAVDEPIRMALHDLPVNFISNPAWQDGQSTSVRAGIQSLPDHCGAAIFLLADQPNLPNELLEALIQRHRETQAQVLATSVAGRRGNPVLFDRATFGDLAQISGDIGGRAIFGKYPPETLEWNDSAILLDVDTPDDYRQLRENG